jgi:hypothetical protein
MKAICVDNKMHQCRKCPIIEVGERVTIIGEKSFAGFHFWRFEEYAGIPGVCKYWYDKRGFATLPEPDADEMREEVRESIVNIETAIV